MTNREFYTAISANEALPQDIRDHATAAIAKLDATAEARKGKVSAKEQAKRDENAKLAAHIVEAFLGSEAKTATDVATAMTAETGEEVKVQKASYLCRLAVDLGLANQTEVKIPKKGTQKAYTAVVAE